MPVVGKLGMEYLCSQNWRLMIIETEHLIIRDFQEKDAVGLLEYLSHPRVNCFVSERLCSEESALAYISNTPKELLRYAVCLKEDDFIIGDVLHCVKKPTHSTWAGISTNASRARDWRMKRQRNFWITFSVKQAHVASTALWRMTTCGRKDCANVSE